MKSSIYIILAAVFFVATSSVFGQDDVYYNPKNDKGKSGYNDANYEDQFNKKSSGNSSAGSNSNSGTDNYDASNSSSKTDGYGNTYVTNNNYYYDDNDFFYTSRLRRYYTPSYGVNFWDPWYTDAFYYTRDPWMWGNSIYVNVIPSWNWWRPRPVIVYNPWGSWYGFNNWNAWNSPWYGNGWNNCGWNSWGYGYGSGWNNYYGGNFYGGGNYWAYNNGYWNGYNQGYYDGAWNNGGWNSGGGYGGRNYGMSGPRFQQSATTNNSGSNSVPGKSGKTDETTVPREGIVKPGNSTDKNIPRDAAKPAGEVKERPDNSEFDRYSGKKVPVDGWKVAPVEERNTPNRNIEKSVPDRLNQRPIQNENAPVERPNRDWNNTPAERPNNGRIDRMRDDLNRDMQPAERPNRTIEQPQRVQPEQRNYQAPQREIRQPQEQPQREIQRSEPQRIERQIPQREMQKMEQPQRQFQQQPQREAPRMERMNTPQQSSPRQMSPGRR